MAFDLLKEEKDSGPHLYRHDLEALFYVMLMICCRHSIIKKPQPHGTSQLEEISANFSNWFERERSWDDFAQLKTSATNPSLFPRASKTSVLASTLFVVTLQKAFSLARMQRMKLKLHLSRHFQMISILMAVYPLSWNQHRNRCQNRLITIP